MCETTKRKYPYSDELMIYDEAKRRYILTPKAIVDGTGIDLSTRLHSRGSANPQATVNGFLDRISVLTYRFINEHSINYPYKQFLVATCSSARQIMYDAMIAQTLYVLTEGDLSLSSDKDKRAMWFDETAKEILLTPLRETGYSLLYCGV